MRDAKEAHFQLGLAWLARTTAALLWSSSTKRAASIQA
jgi:hypothetical protein